MDNDSYTKVSSYVKKFRTLIFYSCYSLLIEQSDTDIIFLFIDLQTNPKSVNIDYYLDLKKDYSKELL